VDKWHGAGAAACLARVEVHPCLTEACLAQWEGSVEGLSERACLAQWEGCCSADWTSSEQFPQVQLQWPLHLF